MQNESEVRAVIARLREWGDLPLHVTHLQSVEAIFDQEHRHKRGAKPVDYLRSWLSMLRPFAFATKDDSWGEMEKLLCIVLRNYIEVRRDAGLAATELERLTAENARLRGLHVLTSRLYDRLNRIDAVKNRLIDLA